MKSKYIIFILIISVIFFSGCITQEKYISGEKYKIFKIFLDYDYGYEYKILYYDNDNSIKTINIAENDIDIYDSNKSLLIYEGENSAGQQKWRIYINQSFPITGIHSRYMVGKIATEKDVIEIPIESP